MNRETRIQENTAKLGVYWDVQEKYYSFLKEKLGARFISDTPNHGGMINNSGWEHLSTFERRCNLRSIALRAIDNKPSQVIFRNGSSLMEASITPESFPYMTVTNHVDSEQYGRRKIGDKCLLWQCNEITDTLE